MGLNNGTRFEQITEMLAWLTVNVELHNSHGRTDINHDAEDFYCGLLNLVLGTSLENMNRIKQNFPAIDLGDPESRLSVQVTSNFSRKKIEETLKKFFENHLDSEYSRLVVLIIGKKERSRKPFKMERFFRFDPKEDIWDTATLLKMIEDLPDEKKDKIIQYLDEQMKLPWKKSNQDVIEEESALEPISADRKLKYELPTTLGFIGRKDELAELEQKLEEDNAKLFFITGLGGMGKTELAVHFGQKQKKRYKVHFARFVESFRQTVIQSISSGVENLWLKDANPDYIYGSVMRVLEECGDDTILIIDNADPPDDQNFDLLRDDTFERLCGMKLRLLITTRAPVPGGVKARRMNDGELREIIGKYAEISEEDANALIEAVGGHTLTIDLMARAMMPGWKRVTPAMLLEALRRNTLSTSIGKTVTTDYSRDGKQAREQKKIYDHLRTVFNVADIPENAKQAMCCATLMPEAGMDSDLFGDALPPAAQEALEELAARAWLRVDSDNKATIHPVVRLICFEELKPTDATCREFLENLWGKYDKKQYYHDLYSTMAEVYTTAAEKLENEKGGWSGRARALWYRVGQYEKALLCAKMTLERREVLLSADDPDLADAYNDMGLAYDGLRDHQRTAECFEKALEIRLRIKNVNPVDLARSYNNVGDVHEEKGDYQTALTYKLKALDIFEKTLKENDLDLATSYLHLGSVYCKFDDYQKALYYTQKSIAIREIVLSTDHPDRATSYSYVGEIYRNLGEHKRALEFQKQAVTIREKILPTDHPDLASSYNNLGLVYGELGDHQMALEYKLKDLAICEKIFSSDHPDLATSYNNIGSTYDNLGDHQTALIYKEKALTIWKKILPADHPELAISYGNVGYTYGKLKKYLLAVQYLKNALRIREAKLPIRHRDTEDTRYWLDYYRRKLENQNPSWKSQIH